jgi:carboxylate-amine ligase
VLEALERAGVAAVAERVEARAREHGVDYGGPLAVDPVPRVVAREEWDALAAALAQRLRALNAFLHDAHGPRRVVAEGVVPGRLVHEAPGFAAALDGLGGPAGVMAGRAWCAIAGPDVVRDADGRLVVLEDNLRLPSSPGYALAAREVVAPVLADVLPDGGLRPAPLVHEAEAALRRTFAAAAPPGVDEPQAVVLTDPVGNDARFEHADVARRLGLPLVVLADLQEREGRLERRDAHGRRHAVDVVYRRSNLEDLIDAHGNPTALERLVGPLRAGTVGVVNALGTGLADDKALMAHLPALVRFLLGEEPLGAQPETRDLGEADALAEVLDEPRAWVLKPRGAAGGQGIVVGPEAEEEQLRDGLAAVRADPEGWVAQAPVGLSVHPTWVDGALAPRRVDLRPLVLAAGDTVTVLPGGMCRVARGADDVLVNLSAGGGLKDVWIV